MAGYKMSVIPNVGQSNRELTGLPVTTTFNVPGDAIVEVLNPFSGPGAKTVKV